MARYKPVDRSPRVMLKIVLLAYSRGLRGCTKVGPQWQLYCLVHNIEKLAHNGYR